MGLDLGSMLPPPSQDANTDIFTSQNPNSTSANIGVTGQVNTGGTAGASAQAGATASTAGGYSTTDVLDQSYYESAGIQGKSVPPSGGLPAPSTSSIEGTEGPKGAANPWFAYNPMVTCVVVLAMMQKIEDLSKLVNIKMQSQQMNATTELGQATAQADLQLGQEQASQYTQLATADFVQMFALGASGLATMGAGMKARTKTDGEEGELKSNLKDAYARDPNSEHYLSVNGRTNNGFLESKNLGKQNTDTRLVTPGAKDGEEDDTVTEGEDEGKSTISEKEEGEEETSIRSHENDEENEEVKESDDSSETATTSSSTDPKKEGITEENKDIAKENQTNAQTTIAGALKKKAQEALNEKWDQAKEKLNVKAQIQERLGLNTKSEVKSENKEEEANVDDDKAPLKKSDEVLEAEKALRDFRKNKMQRYQENKQEMMGQIQNYQQMASAGIDAWKNMIQAGFAIPIAELNALKDQLQSYQNNMQTSSSATSSAIQNINDSISATISALQSVYQAYYQGMKIGTN